ncbi:MAG: S41 family peptidase [Gemmatimonadaceae bacterium]
MPRPRTAATTALLLIPIAVGGFFLQEAPVRQSARLFDQVFSIVTDRYVDSVPAAAAYERAARGLVEQLADPYSELLAPSAREEFARGTNGRYGGIGMLLEEIQGTVGVARVFPHTPAEEGGVREGDRIVAIGDSSTRDWGLSRVSNALRGEPGSRVTVTFLRPGVTEPIRSRFTRRIVRVPAVPYSMMVDGGVGYVPLQTFNENAAGEVREAVEQLRRAGARGLVLDLRENGGGIVEQSLAVTSLFLKEGLEIVRVRGRGSRDEVARTEEPPVEANLPLVVLTDEFSASASEIVAGALQDHDRALVVGQTTFGKGLVQSVFPLDGGYALKLTTAKWYTPSGRSIHKDRATLRNGQSAAAARPDSLRDTARAARPQFRSDAGRIVYGGGGIIPDVIVAADTITTAEGDYRRAAAPKAQVISGVVHDYALELKGTVRPDFTVSPAWLTELNRRLAVAGAPVDPRHAPGAARFYARELEHQVARAAFGDAAAKRRELPQDRQLARAIELLRAAPSQDALFAAVARPR